jgi:outer membrane lipoprotein-sorting protein
LESLSKVIEAVKQLPEIEAPSGFSNRVMTRVREEGARKTGSGKSFPLFGLRGFAYGFIVLLVGGILYYIFEIQKPAPVQLAKLSPPVVQEAPPPPIVSKKKELYRSKPEKKRLVPAPAPSMEAKSEPVQSFNQPAAPLANLSVEKAPVTGGITDSNAMTGLAILQKSEFHLEEDQTSTVTLHLITKEGDEKKIVTKRYWKNFKGKDGISSKTLFFTEWPPDAKGTGFLIWNYSVSGKTDDLWLYLPSLRQTRRVSSRGEDDAFMGSDLTFGDMGQRRVEEDDHKLLKEEPCGDEDCYVVKSVSKGKEGVYSKKIRWITKKEFTAMKIEYYDRKGELLKTQKINWQEVSDVKAWKSSEVVNVQTQHKTLFEISDLKINIGLTDAIFMERTLKTGIR